MLARMWSNRDSHSLLVGMQNGTATVEDCLVLSYKNKHRLMIPSSNGNPWYLFTKDAENICPHRNLYMNVNNSFIHNCQNLEATRMALNR